MAVDDRLDEEGHTCCSLHRMISTSLWPLSHVKRPFGHLAGGLPSSVVDDPFIVFSTSFTFILLLYHAFFSRQTLPLVSEVGSGRACVRPSLSLALLCF